MTKNRATTTAVACICRLGVVRLDPHQTEFTEPPRIVIRRITFVGPWDGRRLTRAKGLPPNCCSEVSPLTTATVVQVREGREERRQLWRLGARTLAATARGHLQMDLTLSLLNRFGALSAEAFYHRLTKQRARRRRPLPNCLTGTASAAADVALHDARSGGGDS